MFKKARIFMAAALILTIALTYASIPQTANSAVAAPVNTDSTEAVSTVLGYFANARAQNKVISGQQHREYAHTEAQHIKDVTGKYPAMAGYDMIFSNNGTQTDVANERQSVVNDAIAYWNNGGLVEISWHQTNPLDATPDAGGWNSVISTMSQSDFNQLVTPGTSLYNKWLAHIDVIAGYLKQLRDAGVVVIWRPYHEMNGNWFWWGAKTGASYIQLWQNMYNRFTVYHGLNNLIWTWSPNKGAANSTYYPAGYVDMGGTDIYTGNRSDSIFQTDNDALSNLMGDHSYGITENGLLPYPANMQNNYDFSWFLTWTTGWCDNQYYGAPPSNGPGNTPAQLQEVYSHSSTITRENLSTLKDGTPPPDPAGNTHSGIWAAKAVVTGSPSWGSLYQTPSGIPTGTNYVASFWMKGSGKITLRVMNSSWSTTVKSQEFTATSAWTQYTLPVFSTGSNTSLVYCFSDSAAPANVYIDDCFLGTSGGTNKLANAGFESGTASWTNNRTNVFGIVQNP